ncbi:MAG: hypothetical protein J6M18_04175 [Actinomycetaceae bacterium]|nr:hypothetical protein [Actinomycetaceae bacterium]
MSITQSKEPASHEEINFKDANERQCLIKDGLLLPYFQYHCIPSDLAKYPNVRAHYIKKHIPRSDYIPGLYTAIWIYTGLSLPASSQSIYLIHPTHSHHLIYSHRRLDKKCLTNLNSLALTSPECSLVDLCIYARSDEDIFTAFEVLRTNNMCSYDSVLDHFIDERKRIKIKAAENRFIKIVHSHYNES